MDMASTAHFHHQEMGSQTLESMMMNPTKDGQSEKKAKPSEQALKCPRCDSTNTKFCYYNNYSLSQPRYFCKSCRRYWTKGGTLRNVPVGGGCRKTAKRSSSSKRSHDQTITTNPSPIASSPLSYDYDHFTPLGLDDHSGFSMPPHVSGFLETPMGGFQSLYYGIGDGVNLGLEINAGAGTGIGMAGLNQEMGFDEIMSGSGTTVKQEGCGGGVGRELDGAEISRGLWGFPWQNIVGGDAASNSIGSWNGIASSPNWHGLLNTPALM
ncbi:hypothetical protein ACS0TY_014954 [Phlomoides rotata]